MRGPAMADDRPIRVRFAPSPTGMLHVGGARTALFNWAFARRHGGRFILRVEDTDRERNSEASLRSILDSMRWLGLDWDEGPEVGGDFGPYFQSERTARHQEAVARGLAEGWLYRCFAVAETVEAQREEARAAKRNWRFDADSRALTAAEAEARAAAGEAHVLRFRVPDGESIVVADHIRGEVVFRSEEVEDWVAVRSDGNPTYNFVCAIDDADMAISHVIRGEEHLVNTPKQVLLFQALGLPVPDYAHVPLILGADGKKLSKRTGDTALGDYIAKGYPPAAMFNFLGLLGFAIDDQTDVFSPEEMVAAFELKRISKAGAIFDPDRLHWLCGEYLRRMTVPELTDAALPFLAAAGLVEGEPAGEERAWLEQLLAAFQPRLTLLADLPEQAATYFAAAATPDEKAGKALAGEEVPGLLAAMAAALEAEAAWPPADLMGLAKGVAGEAGVGLGKLMKPMRAALTGSLGGPELVDIVGLLGRERVLARLTVGQAEAS
jgi:nondiscriminating glutamyl-tRNA synthetase